MGRRFNVNGVCRPEAHYMVSLDARLEKIKVLIDAGEYFAINRSRQSGKTTTLYLLERLLSEQDYTVFSLSFEGLPEEIYAEQAIFCRTFCGLLYDVLDFGEVGGVPDPIRETLRQMSSGEGSADLRSLSNLISRLCASVKNPVVLMIDEVDQAGDQRMFLDFLGMLRNKYLNRTKRPTFQSVILASVYDIKNLRLKVRPEEEHRFNSPWNISADFKLDMNFSIPEIKGMLEEYEREHHTGMDLAVISQWIHEYTSGYPYLVSYLCKRMDEGAGGLKPNSWNREGFLEAVKEQVKGPDALYDDMVKHVLEYPDLYEMLNNILFRGEDYPYHIYDRPVNVGTMFGFIMEKDGSVAVSNRIFESQLYNYFLTESMKNSDRQREHLPDKNQFIHNGILDMDLVMRKFYEYYLSLNEPDDPEFVEKLGRKIFLMYLKPIINGKGNFYVEDQSRSRLRTDVVIDYLGKQYIVELKIWRGEQYNRRGREQLAEYLEVYHLDRGYLLCFCFHGRKETGIRETECGGKTILEVLL